ncbi:hypothetical protein CDAR_232081 [Caerostris darwini]|uniref:Peptidase metallopeptidase domain-containing protein n=1 Tax=Caerostris darwini TaxID=1538125 RepID=A0AAV4P8X8_9ARAC|nr:hypothetical protein CDAR_232081 [Caerostris darwini]
MSQTEMKQEIIEEVKQEEIITLEKEIKQDTPKEKLITIEEDAPKEKKITVEVTPKEEIKTAEEEMEPKRINSNPTWNKNYLTWSLVNGTNYSFLDDVIEMWNIEPLEFARVDPGKGDINIYFKTITSEHVMGYAHYPEEGKVFINDKLKPNQVFYVLQHEFGHALGLTHDPNQNSTMFPYFLGKNVSEYDRQRLQKLYKCHFDSVALINYYTYFKFLDLFIKG